jgi:hypothetical protein
MNDHSWVNALSSICIGRDLIDKDVERYLVIRMVGQGSLAGQIFYFLPIPKSSTSVLDQTDPRYHRTENSPRTYRISRT